MEELKQIPLFEGLPEAELTWLLDHSHEVHLDSGEFFFQESKPADRFYIVLEGELQVTRTIRGEEIVLGTTPRGVMGGELALLNGTPSQVTSRAIMSCRLLVLDQRAFRELFAACPVLAARIFQTAAERTHGLATSVTQQEKLAALGKLAAGLAHELNNPAAAARRAAKTLRETLLNLLAETLELNKLGLAESQLEELMDFQRQSVARTICDQPLPPLEQSDREEAMGQWLESQGIGESWEIASSLVAAQVTVEELQTLARLLPAESTPAVVVWLHETLCATSMLYELELSTRRISDLVSAVKAYTYMDKGPLQEVDIHQGLENTLRVMGHKLQNVEVARQYDPALPRIMARGGELNQVWTNLIDNAIDAMDGRGKLSLITRAENDYVMVEIADNGPGIPPEVQSHLFEPFFTTKEVGAGTGLGLDGAYRIVKAHNGTIEARSQPGHTRFIIRLPVSKV